MKTIGEQRPTVTGEFTPPIELAHVELEELTELEEKRLSYCGVHNKYCNNKQRCAFCQRKWILKACREFDSVREPVYIALVDIPTCRRLVRKLTKARTKRFPLGDGMVALFYMGLLDGPGVEIAPELLGPDAFAWWQQLLLSVGDGKRISGSLGWPSTPRRHTAGSIKLYALALLASPTPDSGLRPRLDVAVVEAHSESQAVRLGIALLNKRYPETWEKNGEAIEIAHELLERPADEDVAAAMNRRF